MSGGFEARIFTEHFSRTLFTENFSKHNFASCKLQLCSRVFSAESSVKERSSLKELTHKFAIHNWPVIDGLSAARISLHSGQQHLWVRISGLHGGIQIMLSKRTSVHLWCGVFFGFSLAFLWLSSGSPLVLLQLSFGFPLALSRLLFQMKALAVI